MSNKLMTFGNDRKKNGGVMLFATKSSRLKRIRGYDTWEEEGGGSRHSFAR